MGWIRERILAENRKHYRVTGGLDWALLAEKKILAQVTELIDQTDDEHVRHLQSGAPNDYINGWVEACEEVKKNISSQNTRSGKR